MSGELETKWQSIGAVAIVLAALLWGSIGVFSVALFRTGVSPWEVAFWRAALSALAIAGWAATVRRSWFKLPGARDALVLGAFGLVSIGLFYSAVQLAMFHTSVAVAAVLLYTAPVFVIIGARLFLGEALTSRKIGAAILVIAGVAATAFGAADVEVRVTGVGIAWGITAALGYSTFFLFGKRYLPRYGIPRTLLYSLTAGAVALAIAASLAGHPPRLDFTPYQWLLLILLAFGTTLAANAVYYWGLQYVAAGTASILASVEPVAAAGLALIFLGQPLSGLGWAGVLLVVVGVASAAENRRTRP